MDRAERMALSVLCDELPALRAECANQSEDVRLLLAHIEGEARAREHPDRPGLWASFIHSGP